MLMAFTRRMLLVIVSSGLLCACAEVKQTGSVIGHTTRDVTRAIGHGTRDVVKGIGHGTRDAAREIGHGTRNAVHGIGQGLKEAVNPSEGDQPD